MLTPAQKKVRQEMEELQINGRLHRLESSVSPPEIHTKQNTMVRRSLIGILLITIITSVMIIFIYKSYTAESTEQVISYLTKIQTFDAQSKQMLEQEIRGFYLDASEIQRAKEMQELLLQKVMDIKTPTSFKNHKHDFIKMLEHRLLIFSHVEKGTDADTLNKYLVELKVKQELQRDSLILAFKNAKITFTQESDGTLLYSLSDKSFQYR